MGRGRGPSSSKKGRNGAGGTGGGGRDVARGSDTGTGSAGVGGATAAPSGDAATARAYRQKLRGVREKTRSAQLPSELKKCRACMICSLIKTEGEFQTSGCDNCEGFLRLAGQRGPVKDYTSANFEGMIAMINPEESWVAKWQRLVDLKPGIYAVNVIGEVHEWVLHEMAEAGLSYISRDKRAKEREGSRKRQDSTNEEMESDDDAGASVVGGAGDAPGADEDTASVVGTVVSEIGVELKPEVGADDFEPPPVEVEMTVEPVAVGLGMGDDNDSVVQGGSVVGISKPKGTDRYHPLYPKVRLPPASDISSACTYRSGKRYESDSSGGESDGDKDKENSDSDL